MISRFKKSWFYEHNFKVLNGQSGRHFEALTVMRISYDLR